VRIWAGREMRDTRVKMRKGPVTTFPRRALRSRVVRTVVAILLATALLYLGTPMIERFFIYFPQRGLEADPSAAGLAFEVARFETSDGLRLHSWFVPGRTGATLLWFHGNAGNISHRLEQLRLLHDAVGANILLVGYRGYGNSEGTPSEKGFYTDALAALSFLIDRDDVDDTKIAYYGQSVGAAVAAELATRHRPAGLILEAPFTSVADMARHHYKFFPARFFVRTRFDTLGRIGSVRSPLLMIHGDHDDIVPIEMARQIFEAARDPKRLEVVRDAGHNDVYARGGTRYLDVFRSFVREATAG
jgi:fermentation-respiration switch protein FrsA (DUF1100 family)